MKTEQLIKSYKERFSGKYAVFSAPGRINIIGEHTDYNNGFVLPGAIDKTIEIVIKINHNSNVINVIANDLKEEESFTKETTETTYHWTRYILGVVCELTKLGCDIPGFDCVFGGNVPVGSGMSSSAALESAVGFALNELLELKLSRLQLAKAGQMAEHNYVGVRCGIMDQFASLFGENGKLVKLDCRSLEYELIPFNPKDYSIVLMDTRVKHSLASSEYNKRRASCEEGVAVIAAKYPEVKSLRDIDFHMLEEFIDKMPFESYKRCLYIIGESLRMHIVCDVLKKNDFNTLGRLMYECHDGLQLLYEVSCRELDFLVNIARTFDGVIGSRMMGGGFGGCTISLAETATEKEFINHASAKYKAEFGYFPAVHEVKIAGGARRIV